MGTITVNKLYGMLAGGSTLKPAKAVYMGSQEIKQMYKGSTLVWEVIDDDDVITTYEYDTPIEIGSSLINEYGESITTVPSSGADVSLQVEYQQVKRTLENGVTVSSTTIFGTTTAIITGGTGSASLSTDGTVVTVSSTLAAGEVYLITRYYFIANDKSSGTLTSEISIVKSTTDESIIQKVRDCQLELSSDTQNISATNGTATIDVMCVKTIDYYNENDLNTVIKSETVNAVANLSSENGSLTPSSVTGGNSSTFSANRNDSTDPVTCTITAVHADDSSITDTITFNQMGAELVLQLMDGKDVISYSAQTQYYHIQSTINGDFQMFEEFNIQLSDTSIAGIGALELSEDYENSIKVPIDFTSNASTSSRDITVTITQPTSNHTLTFTVTQQGKSSSSGGGSTTELTANIDATYLGSTQIDVVIDFSGSSDLIEVYVQIEDVDGTVISERKDYSIIVGVDRIVDNFTISEYTTPCYVVVYNSNNDTEIGRNIVSDK